MSQHPAAASPDDARKPTTWKTSVDFELTKTLLGDWAPVQLAAILNTTRAEAKENQYGLLAPFCKMLSELFADDRPAAATQGAAGTGRTYVGGSRAAPFTVPGLPVVIPLGTLFGGNKTMVKFRFNVKRQHLDILTRSMKGGLLTMANFPGLSGPISFTIEVKGVDEKWHKQLLAGTQVLVRTGGWPLGLPPEHIKGLFEAQGVHVSEVKRARSKFASRSVITGEFELFVSLNGKELPVSIVIVDAASDKKKGEAWVKPCVASVTYPSFQKERGSSRARKPEAATSHQAMELSEEAE